MCYCQGMKTYLERVVDRQIERALTVAGAVEICGPRACGKTESARQRAKSEIRLDVPGPQQLQAKHNPQSMIDQEPPLLLDEWQVVPGIWNVVRHAVDDRGKQGQFLLTGSASPDDDSTRHSGAGRFASVRMRTMSLRETGHSTGEVSLRDLVENDHLDVGAQCPNGFQSVVSRLVSGGWPGWLDADANDAMAMALNWVTHLVERDYPNLAGERRNPRLMAEYVRALAPLISQPASYSSIVKRMQEELQRNVADATVATVHDIATRMYVVEDQPAWSPKLRSASTAAQAPVRHLADPSLAAALLGAGPDRLMEDRETLGFIFKSQVVHDLRIYADGLAAHGLHTRGVFHYRDTKGRDEIDAVVEMQDGHWAGFEVKAIGQHSDADIAKIDQAASKLRRLSAKMVTPPTALAVIVATGVSYTRSEDGVHVIPLGTLGV